MFGLLLCGGYSTRMGSDKGSLVYTGAQTQRLRCVGLLGQHCEKVFVSCREDQLNRIEQGLSVIVDSQEGQGPGVGILSAHELYPDHTWLVLACDFPFADAHDIELLVGARSREHAATCYAHGGGESIEPLFSIWEPEALRALKEGFHRFGQSPSRMLHSLRCKIVQPLRESSLQNVNEPKGHYVKSGGFQNCK